ncbi:hypothetical protein PDESU_04191 [Pontiella desulfatans]|uniref:Oligosaccharide repeat unit polymerase n=1 Tax=Pontiella desulfatans TaxID=2750659 RepID=A0A6C2U873_PONDE|nr:hypothetical protein [Pontiella desulfatans]VGO15606.1 hypothetical protein PDESU_04191 [Pontiella desulfatans]
MAYFSFAAVFLVIAGITLAFVRAQKWDFFTPHTYQSAFFVLLLVFFPALQLALGNFPEETKAIVKTNFMVLLYYCSFSLPFFLFRRSPAAFGALRQKGTQHGRRVDVLVFLALGGMVVCYGLLTWLSGFGLRNWLLYPRLGLQFYRGGVGPLFVGAQLLLVSAYFLILFFRAKTAKAIAATVVFFAFIAYFFGSKGGPLYVGFSGVAYYYFFFRRLSLPKLILAMSSLAVIFIILFQTHRVQWQSFKDNIDSFPVPRYVDFQQKDYVKTAMGDEEEQSTSHAVVSYADHYYYACLFFRDFGDQFHLCYGAEYVNALWTYVPRFIYPEKPMSFGLTEFVIEKYHPGLAAKGHGRVVGGKVFRRGIEGYLNFGVLGLVVAGLVKGVFAALAYRSFLANRDMVSFALVLFMMDFVWFTCPGALLVAWLALFAMALKFLGIGLVPNED